MWLFGLAPNGFVRAEKIDLPTNELIELEDGYHIFTPDAIYRSGQKSIAIVFLGNIYPIGTKPSIEKIQAVLKRAEIMRLNLFEPKRSVLKLFWRRVSEKIDFVWMFVYGIFFFGFLVLVSAVMLL